MGQSCSYVASDMIETTAPVSICIPTGCLLINTLTVNRLESVPFPCTQLLTVNKEYHFDCQKCFRVLTGFAAAFQL